MKIETFHLISAFILLAVIPAAGSTGLYLLSSNDTSDITLTSFRDALVVAISRPVSTVKFLIPNDTAEIENPLVVSTTLQIEGQGSELILRAPIVVKSQGQLSLLALKIEAVRTGDEPLFATEGILFLQQISLVLHGGVAISLQSGEVFISFSDFSGGDTFLSVTDNARMYCRHCRLSNITQSVVHIYPSTLCDFRAIQFAESSIAAVSDSVLKFSEDTNCRLTAEFTNSAISEVAKAFADGRMMAVTLELANTTFARLGHVITGNIANSTLTFKNCTIERVAGTAFSLDSLQGGISITGSTIRGILEGQIFFIPNNPFPPDDAQIVLEDCSISDITNLNLLFSGGLFHVTSVTAIVSHCEIWGLTVLKDGLLYVSIGVAHLSNVLYRDSAVSLTSIMNGLFSTITATNFTVCRVQNNDGGVMATLWGTSGYWRNVSVVDSIDINPVLFNDFITLWVGYGGVYSVENSYFRNPGFQLLSMAATQRGILSISNSEFADLNCSRGFDTYAGGVVNLRNVTFRDFTADVILKCVYPEFCSAMEYIRLEGKVRVSLLFSLNPGQAMMANVHLANTSVGVLKAIGSALAVVNSSFSDCDLLFCKYCINSKVSIASVIMENVRSRTMFDISMMDLEINGLYLRNVEAEQLFAITGSVLVLNHYSAVQCILNELGGFILADGGSSITIESSIVTRIMGKTSITSGLISLQGSVLKVSNCSFDDFNATLISSAESGISINGSRFRRGGPHSSNNICGGVLKSVNSQSVTIADSEFTEIAAVAGGAICILGQSGGVSLQHLAISSCTSVSSGGALYIEGAAVTVTDSTFFSNNSTRGGAIWATSASLQVEKSNFQFNSARLDGGAVQCIKSSFTYDKTTVFANNFAIYGSMIATQVSSIRRVQNGVVTDAAVQAVSGQKVATSLIFGLFDSLGQLVATDNSTQLRLYCTGNSEEISGSVLLYPENGVYTAANLLIIGKPLSTVKIFGETKSFSGLVFEAKLRQCVIGEWFSDSRCIPCTNNMYSLDPSAACALCPIAASCSDGFKLNLEPGYWRSSNVTDRIYSCLVEGLCLGGFVVECAEGHRGVMCNECDPGYFKGSQVQCFSCWGVWAFLAKGLLSALLTVGFTICASERGNTKMLVYVVANSLLMLRVLANLSVLWPASVGYMMIVMGDIGSAGLTAFADLCFRGIADLDSFYSQFLLTIVYYCALVSTVYFLALLARQFSRVNPYSAAFFMAVSVLPLLYLHAVQLLACYEVDGIYRLVYDPSIECWTSTHKKFAFGLALPVMLYSSSVPILLICETLRMQPRYLPKWQAWYLAVTLSRSFAACSFLVHTRALPLCVEAALVLLLNSTTELLLQLVAVPACAACTTYQSTLGATTLFSFACLLYSTAREGSVRAGALQAVAYFLLAVPALVCTVSVLRRCKRGSVVPLQKDPSFSWSLEAPPPSYQQSSQISQLESSSHFSEAK